MKLIGIDTGTHCGIAIYDTDAKKFEVVFTGITYTVMRYIEEYAKNNSGILVKIEDARLLKRNSNSKNVADYGKDSIARDCAMWEETMKKLKLRYELINPKFVWTKLTVEEFVSFTGYEGHTSEHSRDAAMVALSHLKPKP